MQDNNIQNNNVKNQDIITLVIFTISFLLIYCVAYPLYSGRGINLFNTSNIIQEYVKSNQLDNYFNLAQDFLSTGKNQTLAYNNLQIDQKDRINIAIPQKLDIARLVNDIDKMAYNSNINMGDIKFAKMNSVNKNDNINIYKITFDMSGGYNEFKDFLRLLESNLQLLNIQKMSFAPDNNLKDGAKAFSKYSYSIELEAYELK